MGTVWGCLAATLVTCCLACSRTRYDLLSRLYRRLILFDFDRARRPDHDSINTDENLCPFRNMISSRLVLFSRLGRLATKIADDIDPRTDLSLSNSQ